MASISLPSRQILKRRVQAFGRNPVFRFGEDMPEGSPLSMYPVAEQWKQISAHDNSRRRPGVDWALLYRDDPNRAYREFERTKITGLDPDANFYQVIGLPIPPSVIYVSPPSEVVNVQPPFQSDPPVTGPQNTGIPNPPGMTDAQYLEIVEKAKFDSAVIAAANAGRNAKQSDAEVATVDPMSQAGRAKEGSAADIALTPPDPKIGSSKSLVIPAMAAIAAYLMFKG